MRNRHQKITANSLDCQWGGDDHSFPIHAISTSMELSMNTLDMPVQSSSSSSLSGCWKLAAGRAVTLRPRKPGVLRIAHGRVWATIDGPHTGAANAQGDQVLMPGEAIDIAAGQRIVIESWGPKVQASAWFSWDYVQEPVAEPVRWTASVAQPLADLRLALVFGAGAVVRLVGALVRLPVAGLLPRGARGEGARALTLSAASSARRAQGAICSRDSIALSGAV